MWVKKCCQIIIRMDCGGNKECKKIWRCKHQPSSVIHSQGAGPRANPFSRRASWSPSNCVSEGAGAGSLGWLGTLPRGGGWFGRGIPRPAPPPPKGPSTVRSLAGLCVLVCGMRGAVGFERGTALHCLTRFLEELGVSSALRRRP